MAWTRRDFLRGTGAAGGPVDADIPTVAAIMGWIEEIFEQGIRRPGYPADEWAVNHSADRFRRLGMENVRLEPVEVTRWEPISRSLLVTPTGADPVELECLPVPYAPAVSGLDVDLIAFDPDDPGGVAGNASLYDVTLLELPGDFFVSSGRVPDDLSGRVVDPDGTLPEPHRLPFGAELQAVIEPSAEAGAAAFIGSLKNYPGDSYQYFVPYNHPEVPAIPGVWISGSDGDWLADQLAAGPVRVQLTVESTSERFESHNVVGELPGADDETVIIASHHDGPWGSAIEDASGMSLVFAQAEYWAAQPVERRPHRLVFLLNAGHMSPGNVGSFVDTHRDELDDVVLQIHLEHAALECIEQPDGTVVATDQPTPRWYFTSRIPQLERAVVDALTTEELHRSMLLAPDAVGDKPSTDGAWFYPAGVPLTHFLAAPFYLFDAMDTPDKIDREHLVPLTRAVVRIIDSTAGVTAAEMRAADLAPPLASSGE